MKSLRLRVREAVASRMPTIFVLECLATGQRAIIDVDYRRGVRLLQADVEEHIVADQYFLHSATMHKAVDKIVRMVDPSV